MESRAARDLWTWTTSPRSVCGLGREGEEEIANSFLTFLTTRGGGGGGEGGGGFDEALAVKVPGGSDCSCL